MTQDSNPSGLDPQSPGSAGSLLDRPVRSMSPRVRRMALYVGAAVPIGLLAGLLWTAVTGLPGYTLADNGSAAMSERGLTGFFSADFWFVVIGVIAGVGIGIWGWLWFGHRGWILLPLALSSAVLAALLCWWVGESLGPTNFDQRLSQARPGDVVSIDLDLRAHSALAAWPFGAIIPVMIASAFLSEPGGPRRRRRGLPTSQFLSEPVLPGGPAVAGHPVSEELDRPQA